MILEFAASLIGADSSSTSYILTLSGLHTLSPAFSYRITQMLHRASSMILLQEESQKS